MLNTEQVKKTDNVTQKRETTTQTNTESQGPGILSALTTPLLGPYKELYRKEREPQDKEEIEEELNTEPVSHRFTLKWVTDVVRAKARTTAIIKGLASIVESSAALASFYFGANVFRSLETIYQGGTAGSELAQNLGIVAGLGLVALYSPFSRLVGTIFNIKLSLGFREQITTASLSRRPNDLENEFVEKEVTQVRENQWRLPQLASGLIHGTGKVLELTIAGALLGGIAYKNLGLGNAAGMLWVLSASTVPRILSEYRYAKDILDIEDRIAHLRRKFWYFSHYVTDTQYIGELKNLGQESEMKKRALKAEEETVKEYLDAEKRNTVQQSYAYSITKLTTLGCVAVFMAKAWSGGLAPEVLGIAVGTLYRFSGALSSISSILGEQLKHFSFARRAATLVETGKKTVEEDRIKRIKSLDFSGPPLPIILDDVS